MVGDEENQKNNTMSNHRNYFLLAVKKHVELGRGVGSKKCFSRMSR
jgi:hypothetical protein